jgi:tetratricopeptide (TPR) repeat protein
MTPMRWISVLVFSLLAVTPVSASVDEAWLEVQEVLSAPGGRSLQEPVDDLINEAKEIDLRRMTPYAAALVSWSHANPDADASILETAITIDPELPASYFLLSRRGWQQRSYGRSARFFFKGWLASFQYEVTRRHLLMSLAAWLIIGTAVASLVGLVVMMLRTVRRSNFDAMTLGSMVFDRGNAVVFGLVLILLPLFAGLGPVWLLVYLFVVGWVYLDHSQQIIAVAICLVLASVPMVADSWQRALLREPPVTDRVAVMLDERQLNPSALREFLSLKDSFDGDTSYHLIRGELLRMHSAVESAKIEFQTAAVEPLGDARPFVFLGNMALEDGNVQLAIQYYDAAIDTDSRTALAYHNLSSAYDLNRRFQQGDAARARARELAGGRSASLGVRGRDPRVRYPSVTSDDVDEFVSGLLPEERLYVGFSASSWRSVRQLLDPMSMVFWVCGIFGLGLLSIRSRWFPPAKECTKCGKTYRLDDEPGESPVYCRQCVSVFLQRDLVPIDQQTAKLAQVRRWDRWTTVLRRLTSAIAPGSYQLVQDQVAFGVILGLVAWTSLIGVVVWVPRFLEVIEPTMPVQPVVVILAIVFFAAWLRSVIGSWQRR